MWWRNFLKSQTSMNVQETLDSLQSDGIHLAMPELLAYRDVSQHIKFSLKPKGYLAGNFLSRSKGRGMEFDEVRQYHSGDDVRTIDWRVTARTGKVHTKLYREELERPVLIACDLNGSMNFGSQLLFKSVQAGHLAAILAWNASGSGDRVGGLVFNESNHIELKPAGRQKAVLTFLNAIINKAQLNQSVKINSPTKSSSEYFTQNLARLRVVAKPGTLVYVISDFYQLDDIGLSYLSQIAQHCELVCCQITDPLEHELPQVARQTPATLSDGVDFQTLILGSQEDQERYTQLQQRRQNNLAKQLAQIKAKFVQISAAKPLHGQLEAIWTH